MIGPFGLARFLYFCRGLDLRGQCLIRPFGLARILYSRWLFTTPWICKSVFDLALGTCENPACASAVRIAMPFYRLFFFMVCRIPQVNALHFDFYCIGPQSYALGSFRPSGLARFLHLSRQLFTYRICKPVGLRELCTYAGYLGFLAILHLPHTVQNFSGQCPLL